MGLREPGLTHIRHQTHLVLVAQVFEVNRESVAAPDKLEIEATLLVRETFKDSPESADYLMVLRTVGICGD